MSLNVYGILAEKKAIRENGHYVLNSMRHSRKYVNKDAIYPHTRETSMLCEQIALNFLNADDGSLDVDVVVGLAAGGIILSQWVAHHMTAHSQTEILGVYADKVEGSADFVLKRGYDEIVRGKKVLLVEDILTTGGSVKRGIDAIRTTGGNLVGVAAVCNRGGVVRSDVGADDVPFFSALLDLHIETWEPEDCPICNEGIPVDQKFGHGKKFLESKAS